MQFLAISGSARAASTNTAMLRAIAATYPGHEITVFNRVDSLPVFSPDKEAEPLPQAVEDFAEAVDVADGLIIACPEYVRSIPGGMKNAIDWLVSREELIGKPIALVHASRRGDDMLAQLRTVLATVSEGFAPDIFLRIDLLKFSADEIREKLQEPVHVAEIMGFLTRFSKHCAQMK